MGTKKKQSSKQEEIDKIFIKIFYIIVMILEGKTSVDNIYSYIKKLRCIIDEQTDPNITATNAYESLKKLGIWETIGFMFSVKSFSTIIADTINILRNKDLSKSELKQKTEDVAISYITSNFINLIVESVKNKKI